MNNRTRRGGGITRASYTTRPYKRMIAQTRTARRRRSEMTGTRKPPTVAPTPRRSNRPSLTRPKQNITLNPSTLRTPSKLVKSAVIQVVADLTAINDDIADAMRLRDTIVAELSQPYQIGRSNSEIRDDFKRLLTRLKNIAPTSTFQKGSANRSAISLLRQQCSKKQIPYIFNINDALQKRGAARSAAHMEAASAADPIMEALMAGIAGL